LGPMSCGMGDAAGIVTKPQPYGKSMTKGL